ncbi:MAG: helix-turn-helix transcriptional regulator [Sphingomonadales bacterium]|nr:helix-turn-helix transcriptional regulator [Sphingomonadales bacterium]MDE2170733.1 helix-turn-helix transcriptional regulator [Sphingomonadales bacterium]
MVQNKEGTDVKRRGRPRAYDPAAALAQARDAFWRHGYSGTSLDEISAATGMNRPSLSAAFGDKRAIYLAALRDYWVAKFATMDRALDAERLQDALLGVYDASLSLYFTEADGARGCFVVGTAVTESVDDHEIREIAKAGFNTLDAKFADRFRLAQHAGEIAREADVEALALLATATLHTLAVRSRAGTPCEELRRLARKAVAMICR